MHHKESPRELGETGIECNTTYTNESCCYFDRQNGNSLKCQRRCWPRNKQNIM